MSTLMWEARAADGRLAELLAYVDAAADPSAEIYAAADPDPRVVVLDPTGGGVGDVPRELVAREPHAWVFDRVHRSHRAQDGAARD